MSSGIPPIRPSDFRTIEGISLKMTAKGYYYWDINASGELNQGLIDKLRQVDAGMRQNFPQNVTMLPAEFGTEIRG